MSRIRSIHPGLWTDEDFVTLSPLARLLFMGIWNECDDKGIFEWKPLTLKMRLLPGDNTDVSELLAEIEAIGAVRRYEIGGKSYGAVRNFGKFQRPKKPNDIHPATAEILAFCAVSSEPQANERNEVRNQFPTGGEIAKQMEDGGGNSSSVSTDTDGAAAFDPDKIMFDAGVNLITSTGKSQQAARSWLAKARRDYGTEAVISAIGRAKREGAIEPVSFMEGALRANKRAAQPEVKVGI